jgi:hypothetical protein
MKSKWSKLLLLERKEQDMRTYETIKAQLMKDFSELQQLPVQGRMAQAERAFKEELIGQHCYDAEKSLDLDDLLLLKETLGLDERAWRAYKGKLTHSL